MIINIKIWNLWQKKKAVLHTSSPRKAKNQAILQGITLAEDMLYIPTMISMMEIIMMEWDRERANMCIPMVIVMKVISKLI